MWAYFQRVGVAFSNLLNVILGGHPHQTFSARNYARKRAGKLHVVPLIDAIYWRENNHCMDAWIWWRNRKDVIDDYTNERFKD